MFGPEGFSFKDIPKNPESSSPDLEFEPPINNLPEIIEEHSENLEEVEETPFSTKPADAERPVIDAEYSDVPEESDTEEKAGARHIAPLNQVPLKLICSICHKQGHNAEECPERDTPISVSQPSTIGGDEEIEKDRPSQSTIEDQHTNTPRLEDHT